MWDCPHCGCRQILDLLFCPQCHKPRDVAAESGQTSEGLDGSPVGSTPEELSSSPSGDNSGAALPSPGKKTKNDSDWGKD